MRMGADIDILVLRCVRADTAAIEHSRPGVSGGTLSRLWRKTVQNWSVRREGRGGGWRGKSGRAERNCSHEHRPAAGGTCCAGVGHCQY